MKFPDMTQAACAGTDVNFFFPDTVGQEASIRKYLTKICDTCPIFDTCLEYALAVKVDGIWAGTTAIERRKMRKEKGIVGIALVSQYHTEYLLSQSPEAVKARKSRMEKTQATKAAMKLASEKEEVLSC